jgi:hypothetical protein
METWARRTAEGSERVRYDTRKEVIWVSHEGKCGKQIRHRGPFVLRNFEIHKLVETIITSLIILVQIKSLVSFRLQYDRLA